MKYVITTFIIGFSCLFNGISANAADNANASANDGYIANSNDNYGATQTSVVVDFTAPNTCVGRQIQFENLTTIQEATLISWTWYFGDGLTSNNFEPVKTYSTAGTYKVRLVVSVRNKSGVVKEFSLGKYIRVGATPTSDFSYTISCAHREVKFKNLSTVSSGSIKSSIWVYGDGQTEVKYGAVGASHRYSSVGTYNVRLTVVTDKNCTDRFDVGINVCDGSGSVAEADPMNDIMGGSVSDPNAIQDLTNVERGISDAQLNLNLYPNPFSSQFNISYNLEKQANVSIIVYDLTGKEIQIVKNGIAPAGSYNHSIGLENESMKSGLYIVRVVIDNQVFNRQMIKM